MFKDCKECKHREQYKEEEPVCNYLEKNYLLSRLRMCPADYVREIERIEEKGW
jgi:hypothetical protein